MNEKMICPWCDTEIVWDEVLGPEEECPYCHNELNEYRSFNVNLEVDEDLASDRDDQEQGDEDKEEKGWSNFGWGDEAMLFGSADDMRYQRGVDQSLQGQHDVPECPSCREYMLLVGRERMDEQTFTPHVAEDAVDALIQAPLELEVYVCSSCFQVTKKLGQAERESLKEAVRRISELDEEDKA